MSATARCPNCTDLHVVDGKMSVGEGVYQSGCPNCGMLGSDDPTPEGAAHRWRSFCEAMGEIKAERDAMLSAWPEQQAPKPGWDLLLPPTADPAGPRMYGDGWPRVKADIVRRMLGLGATAEDAPR